MIYLAISSHNIEKFMLFPFGRQRHKVVPALSCNRVFHQWPQGQTDQLLTPLCHRSILAMPQGDAHKQHRCFRLSPPKTRNFCFPTGLEELWSHLAPAVPPPSISIAFKSSWWTPHAAVLYAGADVRFAMRRRTKSLPKKSRMLLSTSKLFIFNQQFSKDLLNGGRGSAAATDRWMNYHKANHDKYCAKGDPSLVLAARTYRQVDCWKTCGCPQCWRRSGLITNRHVVAKASNSTRISDGRWVSHHSYGHRHPAPALFPMANPVSVYMPPTLHLQLNRTQTHQGESFCLAAACSSVLAPSLTNPIVSPGFGRTDHIVSCSTEPCLKGAGAAQSSSLARGLLSGGEATLLL